MGTKRKGGYAQFLTRINPCVSFGTIIMKMNTMLRDTLSRGVLTLIISEMQEIIEKSCDKYVTKEDCLQWMRELLDAWIKPNDFHPERVKTVPKELTDRIKRGDRTVWKEVFKWYSKGDVK